MTAWAPGFTPVQDGDSAWATFEGDVRVRTVAGAVQLQVSTDNGDGTFSIATLLLHGSLRDVRHSTVKWPTYNSAGLPTNVVTDAERRAGEVLAAQSRGLVPGGNGVPIDRAARKADGYTPN